MKVRSNKRQISDHKNGDLVSSKRRATRKIVADCPKKKKKDPKVTSKLEAPNISTQRCVLHDKTNTFATNVKSYNYTPVGYRKSENSRLQSATDLAMSRKNLSNSFSSHQKETDGAMEKGATRQNEANTDVYEFILDEGEANENKPKTKKQSKRKRVQRKIIDSPEEVLPAKKIRKPLQDKVSKNLIPKSKLKNLFVNEESKFSAAKFFSDVSHPSKMKMKTVHFNNPSVDKIIKPLSRLETKLCTPKGSTKNVSSPENEETLNTYTKTSGKGSTPNLLTSQRKSLRCMTERNQLCSPSASECNRQDLRMKENEITRKLMSFFSPPQTACNSGNNYSFPVTEKTPAKQVATRSCNAEMENTEISHSENVQPSLPSDEAEEQCDKIQKTLDLSNCFGFDDDVDSDDEDFSPAKRFTKSSHKSGKFQCSTPKEAGQRNCVSQPFRFPTLSIIKKRKFLQTAGNTPATIKNPIVKTACLNSDSASKRKPGIPISSPVKESSRPAIFDLEDEVHECQDDDKYESEHQQGQKKDKDCEANSSPQKKVVQKSYATPRHQTRLRRPVHDEVKEDSTDDEAEEVPKKHKKTHKATKQTKEVDEWAKCFNSMCETIDSFELVVE